MALYAALLLGFLVLLCRLYWIAMEPSYAERVQGQSKVTLELPAHRGQFYDYEGRLLTGLQEKWLALCFPGEGNYAKLYDHTDAAGQALLYRNRNRSAPFLLEVDADLSRMGANSYLTSQRYCTVPLCQHLIGYLDADGKGIAGLEKAFETLLSGTGERDVIQCNVTAQGKLRAGEEPELFRADTGAVGVKLTISRPIQRMTEAIAAETMTTGCILVLDVRTAEVRASVSVPGYDPQDLEASLNAADSPFLNRVLERYAVGSVFKPVLAAAALEEGVELDYECTGACWVDGQIFRCSGGVPHGQTELASALKKSCNGYFIQLGQAIGAETLLEIAQEFGFGRGCWIAGNLSASAGTLPNQSELAQSGQLANFSFGQGSLTASPVQVAGMMNTIAAGGIYRMPSFVKGTLDETSGEMLEIRTRSVAKRVISSQTAQTLCEMLVQVVEQGTAKDAAGLTKGAGGKTGTAQTGRFDADGTELKNFWFAGFYPAEDPEYTVVVMQDGQQAPHYSSARIFARLCELLELAE